MMRKSRNNFLIYQTKKKWLLEKDSNDSKKDSPHTEKEVNTETQGEDRTRCQEEE